MKYYTMRQAMDLTGCTRDKLEKFSKKDPSDLSRLVIPSEIIDSIVRQKAEYISLGEYAEYCAKNGKNDRFKVDGTKIKGKESMLDYLEENKWFGVTTFGVDEMVFTKRNDLVFFKRTDIPHINDHILPFLSTYGLSEKEKLDKILKASMNKATVFLIRSFISTSQITPSYVAFASIMSKYPDIKKLAPEIIESILLSTEKLAVKKLIKEFLNDISDHYDTNYGKIIVTRKEKHPITAYSNDVYFDLAKCVFNAEYIYEHQMIEKALSDHMCAEAWLYIALLYSCGWRARDICRAWKYPRLQDHENGFLGINKETLHDDILYDRIEDGVYEQVCLYSMNALEVSGQIPKKTSAYEPSALHAIISPGLRAFYGLLTLIGEAHAVKMGDGYMNPSRINRYSNRMFLRSFMGEEIHDILGGNNLCGSRLNKDYLQGIESAARQAGYGGVMASAVASYARNHTDLSTIKSYLKDHSFTGEDAETILFFMMDRGVFGFEYYQALLTAYPDEFRKLPLEVQNKILSMSDQRPLGLENKAAELYEENNIRKDFIKGNDARVLEILMRMFEISQMRGKGKDSGVYCILRAGGDACTHPQWESCLANACPHLVLTQLGIIPLIHELMRVEEKANDGDAKAKAVLKQILIPRFQSIINCLMRETGMSKEEKTGIKKILEKEMG